MYDTGKDLMRDPTPDTSPDEDTAFPIVGIGASAGGLGAFIQFLEHLPTTTGMAYIFVQHLDPSHNSLLPDLLVRVTKMPLCVAQDQMMVEADHVYVIPPNTELTLEQGTLHLVPRTLQSGLHLTIDRFFRSLAQDRTYLAIGVLLSGTGSDGTAGLQAIKAQGGMTFAQDEQSAKYPQMPLHAIAAGWVDRILPPEEIARVLSMLNRQPSLAAAPLETQALSSAEQQDFMKIRLLLRSATNVDFLAYRSATLQRRILRRMAIVHIDQISAYVTYMDNHPAEVEALSQEVLIHVTSFFRDPGTFEALTRLVFPELVQHLLPGDSLRLWVAGCSTGEEAYSLAICLLEYLEEHALDLPFQLFATDLDAAAIKQARTGIYLMKTMQEVSPQRLQRFFLPLERSREQYQISKAIRERCVFARQNVANDPPFSRLDLVSCRNVLIYLTLGAQEKVLQALHYALKPHGFLLLGASESVGLSSPLFRHVEPHLKLFLKKSWGRNPSHRMTLQEDEPASRTREASSNKRAEKMMNEFDVQQEVDRLLLTTYAPASVVIDDDLQILHIRGRTSPYLEPAPGKADFHLLKWVRDGLKLGVRTAIQAAQKENHPISREGLQVSGTTRMVRVTVVPLQGTATVRCFLVLFEESPSQAPQATEPRVTGVLFGRQGKRSSEAARMSALEQELVTIQAEVQAILEERDRTNERLQAANEEVRSSNEELQSLNEELETSQAELQASNEELTIANQELQTRNEQLRMAQDYASSIVETVREPLVVLDANLRLLSANTAFYLFFQVTPPETEHHVLSELGNGQWALPQLQQLLEKVQVTNQSFHDIEVEHHFPAIGHKIMLLNGRRIVSEQEGTRNHLILLAMEDITARRELEQQKETFLGMVGHELKTPLTSAKGFVQLLQRRVRKAGDEQTANELGKIDTHLDKLAHLIRSLLDVSALETGTLSIRSAPFAVKNLVREIVEEREHSSPGRLRLENITPAEAYGDRERTGQVLLNLLTNALKYSAPTDPVWVRTSVHEDGITLSVQDLGSGIPLDQQTRIFERFARVDQPSQGNVPGVGLGLYIAAQIISQQRGRIWVESIPGKGSTFFFTLPCAPHAESDKK
jgi:two-component system, chemotaxis family, CheB/CheR fusion protein